MISRRALFVGVGASALAMSSLARAQDSAKAEPPCPMKLRDGSPITLDDGKPLTQDWCRRDPATGQQKGHIVMTPQERAKGLSRPVRRVYTHLRCGKNTSMSQDIAETFARDPKFYNGRTFCTTCKGYFPYEEFVWQGTKIKLGT